VGLLPGSGRPQGRHRLYDAADEARLRELLRVRDLLGLSLADLRTWSEAETARAALRERWEATDASDGERVEIVAEAMEHIDRQLELVRGRRAALEALEDEMTAKRRRMRTVLAELQEAG
jgi:MerR family transcriptional regulator, repressor of the yfmOP operon